MFPNLEKLFGEKNYYMKHGIVSVYTKKLFESHRILYFLWFYSCFSRISLISSFRLKQVNGLELLCPIQHLSTLTDAEIM